MNSLSFIFLGTSAFSVHLLEALYAEGCVPKAIVTLPDAPSGRKQILTSPPVKKWGEDHNIPVLQPQALNSELLGILQTYAPDFLLVASYGKFIPGKILESFPARVLNVHPSLLPFYRGATPIQTAILRGEQETGSSIMVLDNEMDHGPIIGQSSLSIEPDETYPALEKRLAELSGALFVAIIPGYLEGTQSAKPQNHELATYTKKYNSEDARIDPHVLEAGCSTEEASRAYNMVRALNPEPGTWTELSTKRGLTRIKILSAHIATDGQFAALVPDKIIPAGKTETDWSTFSRNFI